MLQERTLCANGMSVQSPDLRCMVLAAQRIAAAMPRGDHDHEAQPTGFYWSSQRSASSAAMQPKPAEVIAWR